MRDIQASSTSRGRAFGAGNEPITPWRHAAITRSGPETRNIGAQISGSASWSRSAPRRSRRTAGAVGGEIVQRRVLEQACTTRLATGVRRDQARRGFPRPRVSATVPLVSDVALHIATSSVTRAIDVVGDRWALLILRDAFQGARRFEEFVERTGATRATLTNRLRALVEEGILDRVRYSTSPPRFEYRMTRRGRDLFPVALAAWRWERRWAGPRGGVPTRLRHEVLRPRDAPGTRLRGLRRSARPAAHAIPQPDSVRPGAAPAAPVAPAVAVDRRDAPRVEFRHHSRGRRRRRPLDAADRLRRFFRPAPLRGHPGVPRHREQHPDRAPRRAGGTRRASSGAAIRVTRRAAHTA